MRSVPGLFCKGGAEAVYAVGLADGRGIAVKIDDGASRARAVVVAAVLRWLGVDNDVIRTQLEHPLLGGGQPVGSVRPAAELTTLLS
jgi:L-asparaginase II